MSRRRGEFEHRTSIFEGAFRAWSHLGGLDPEELETKSPAELDPLTNPIEDDPRLGGKKFTPDGRREYPYEPLPRSGLAHPYVQAILSPWLGPDADNEAIQLGLTTLRTWWQHRRKGESGSAVAALGTEKMKGVVEGYTRHFFTLAHCVVVNDRVQPPRGLHAKMKEREKLKNKRNKNAVPIKKDGKNDEVINVNQIRADLTDPNLTPLEKLHVAQRRQMESNGSLPTNLPSGMGITAPGATSSSVDATSIDMTGKCIPGKLDLPGVVDQVNHQATQLAHRGGGGTGMAPELPSSAIMMPPQPQFGDPNSTPVVFVSSNGAIQIAMKVEGITCAHCVKIVETVLRGCNGNRSPINGLLDAAADRDMSSVLIRIDKASNAKRIAFEAARNLSMVGYSAEPKSMSIIGQGSDPKSHMELGALSTAFEVVAATDQQDVFDWSIACSCPDNGVLRGDCPRHSQMNTRIFDAFESREDQVKEYMAGCGMKYGMQCTCGPDCRCKNCSVHGNNSDNNQMGQSSGNQYDEAPFRLEQPMQFSNFGMGPPASVNNAPPAGHPTMPVGNTTGGAAAAAAASMPDGSSVPKEPTPSRAQRNPSVLSYGNAGLRSSLRGMSITSETTFGRAMSGLSALSIDWENLDDFDLDVDHSAHINNGAAGNNAAGGRRRSSIRRSIMSTGSQDGGGNGAHVSFRV